MKRPILKFPDREFTCEAIQVQGTTLNIVDGLWKVTVTDYGAFIEQANGFLFVPHLQLARIHATKPRPAGRPKAPPPDKSNTETFSLVQTSGPRHRREKKPKNVLGGKPTAPVNR